MSRPPAQVHAVELDSVPFFAQTAHHCGPAALATVLNYAGVAVTVEELAGAVYLPEREGSLQIEMLAAARSQGVVPFMIPPTLDALLAELNAARPVLVLQNLGLQSVPRWHYAVVVGYDPARDSFVLRSGTTRRKLERRPAFERSWALAAHWALVLGEAERIPASATAASWVRTLVASEAFLAPSSIQAAYRHALDRWPADGLLLFAAGNFFFGNGLPGDAHAAYRRLLELEPGHRAARNNLANLLLEAGCLDEAQAEIRLAASHLGDADPLAAAVRDSQAEIEAALGAAADGERTCSLH